MEGMVSITDELREFAASEASDYDDWVDGIRAIADNIDAAHRSALEKLAAQVDESEDGWVRLPVDADGVPIRPGDELVIFETGEHIRAYDIELYDDGRWLVCDDETMDSIHPDRLRHRAPTVEDVLDEFFGKANLPDGTQTRAEIIAEYAAKLRLAGEGE